jgi:hypothetical protein
MAAGGSGAGYSGGPAGWGRTGGIGGRGMTYTGGSVQNYAYSAAINTGSGGGGAGLSTVWGGGSAGLVAIRYEVT